MPAVDNILECFNKKINLLIVDDEPIVLDVVKSVLSSPLFNIHSAFSLSQAFKVIDEAKEPWHSWVLDINIGDRDDGIDIIKRYPKYPFAVMLSGLRSMTKASQALQSGAMKVFDKTPESLELMHDEVCKIAALGFILGGRNTQYLSNFTNLTEHTFSNPSQWAESSCITVRQLERICSGHSLLSPKYCISLFYALSYVLSKDEDITFKKSNQSEANSDENIDPFYHSHVDFVSKNLEKYRAHLFK